MTKFFALFDLLSIAYQCHGFPIMSSDLTDPSGFGFLRVKPVSAWTI